MNGNPSQLCFKLPLTKNFRGKSERSGKGGGGSNNEPILPLPYRISNEANRMWYNAKLRIRLVVECTIHSLLESQVGSLEHFRAMRIHLDQAILAQILGEEGHSVFYECASTSIFADPTWVYSEALARFGKVASLLIGTNISPQSPDQTNNLRMINVYIMDNMRSRSPFSLSHLYSSFFYVINVALMLERVIGFSQLLSRVFHHFHIDFSGPDSEKQATEAVEDDEEDDLRTAVIN
ncbi:hypothetical protein M9H77_35571 [Catharanthus roseus]|uniref:Uncharacterized protein n=1 Tax=Catharanthus roseus TaxID=4058 RepID=A0ACB9ZPC8_CATRO|nr:hypothetical protein M9H77_35571 [Catharanthus roseus]